MEDLDRSVCICACHSCGNERHSDCCVIATLRARVASLEAAGEAFLGQIGYGRKVHRGRGEEVVHEVNGIAVQAFRAALAPRSERREGEPGPMTRAQRIREARLRENPAPFDGDEAPPAAPKEEAK